MQLLLLSSNYQTIVYHLLFMMLIQIKGYPSLDWVGNLSIQKRIRQDICFTEDNYVIHTTWELQEEKWFIMNVSLIVAMESIVYPGEHHNMIFYSNFDLNIRPIGSICDLKSSPNANAFHNFFKNSCVTSHHFYGAIGTLCFGLWLTLPWVLKPGWIYHRMRSALACTWSSGLILLKDIAVWKCAIVS